MTRQAGDQGSKAQRNKIRGDSTRRRKTSGKRVKTRRDKITAKSGPRCSKERARHGARGAWRAPERPRAARGRQGAPKRALEPRQGASKRLEEETRAAHGPSPANPQQEETRRFHKLSKGLFEITKAAAP